MGGKGFRRRGGIAGRIGEHHIDAVEERHLGAHLTVGDSRHAALNIIAAHEGDDAVGTGLTAHFVDQKLMAVVKGVEFSNNGGNSHNESFIISAFTKCLQYSI